MIDISKRLTFSEEGHVYRLDGVVVPSITQCLECVQWDQFDFVDRKLLALRAAEGSMLHRMIEFYEATGEFTASDCARTDAEWEMMCDLLDDLDAYLEFKRSTGFIVETTEQMVASARYGFAGRLDLTGRFPDDDDLHIIDTKRTAAIPKSVGLQTAAQELAYRETFDIPDSVHIERHALHLRLGKYKLARQIGRRDRATFLACLTATHWRNS